jgi:hypothetical protein
LSIEKEWITWPDEEERRSMVKHMEDKLPNCIGFIDGSHITLEEAPTDDPESYFTRKQRYAIHIQAVCDMDKRIRNVTIGYPGSVHDARVYKNSNIGRNPQQYLTEGQWIAGDSAYGVSEYLLTPFRSNTASNSDREKRNFNKYFAGFRVNIECVFGILKETFGSLKGLRIRVNEAQGHQIACEWILACCVLYNIISPSLAENDIEWPENEDDNDDGSSGRDQEGENKRQRLLQFVNAKLAV